MTIAYNRIVVLSRVSLTVPAAQLAALVGPVGAGKSSLMRCLLGRQRPSAGEVRVLGRAPAEARQLVAYVPPVDSADWRFPLSVGEVVMMGRYGRLGLLRRPGPADRALVLGCLEQVGLRRFAERRATELSVARRRLCLLARALVQEPELLLLDEPWSAPVGGADDELLELLARLRDGGMAVLVATSDLARVRDRFDWVAMLNGQLVAQGRPTEVFTAANLRTAYGAQPVTLSTRAEYFATDA